MQNRNSVAKKSKKKKPLDLKGVAKIMANPTEVEAKTVLKTESVIPDSLDAQIEDFFKSGKTVIKAEDEDRAMPEFTWWKQSYPKNYRKRWNK
ncbi:MAG: hypothetical protein CME31_07870 [Gimesia sp.]|nr:hypothetical protein [Gimesia sp.]|tara:strand:- start:1568 stop:1846 length:279 start_codon:yes stop_codon:yes gene_type:complete